MNFRLLLPPAALLLTVLIETPLARAVGVKNRGDLLLVALMNCVTNPLLNLALLFLSPMQGGMGYAAAVTAGEALVVLAEGAFLRRALQTPPRRPCLVSLALNAASFTTGLVIAAAAGL